MASSAAQSRLFVDTNVFLRHLLDDDPIQSPASLALMEALERNELAAWTTEVIVAEIVWVLSARSGYNRPREHVRDLLLPLFELPGLRVPYKRIYRRAFALYVAAGIDYVDAFHAALLENRGETELYSFDTHFDRVPTLQRREP